MRAWLVAGFLCAALPPPPAFTFHHLHLRDSPPTFLVEFYERLFDPAIARRTSLGDFVGIEAGATRIFVSPGDGTESQPTGLWHFGWGDATLGETYLAHARREVSWEPPLPADRLHMHLRSATPRSAATWYGDVLGASVHLPPTPRRRTDAVLPSPEHRMPDALVHIGGMALLIYETEPPIFSSLGRRIDHLAFACDDLDAVLSFMRTKAVSVLSGPARIGEFRVAMIEGPDRVAIELVESAK